MTVLDTGGAPEGGETPAADAPPRPGAPAPGGTGPSERRPIAEGPIRKVIDVAVVAGCAAFVFWQLHPALIVSDSTPAGGDMGAHVWAFGYLRDVLLPDLRWSGWTPDWYAGFPVFQFYMVVPFLWMVLLNAGLSGAGALLPAGASLATSSRSSGIRRPRSQAAVAGVGMAVFAVVGVWSGFGPGVRFAMIVGCAIAAVLAAWVGDGRRARWTAAVAVAIAVIGISLPYGAAFKAVTVLGVVTMPISAYAFGRLARFPFPTPALLSVATLAFLFDKYFTIYGGNIASTMAGEFAFSISLSLAIAYLGVLIHGLRTGTHRATAAAMLALVGLCHLIPAFFALAATAVLLAVHVVSEVRRPEPGAAGDAPRTFHALLVLATLGSISLAGLLAVVIGLVATATAVAVVAVASTVVVLLVWTGTGGGADHTGVRQRFLGAGRLWWVLSTGVVAALLAAWWVLPFFWQRTYVNDMGWGKIAVHTDGVGLWAWFTDSVWPELVPTDLRLFAALALVGAVLSVVFRHRVGTSLVVLGLILAAAFVFVPQGRLWNARLLPFWYLVVYFLAAVGIGEVVRALSQVLRGGRSSTDRVPRAVTWAAAPLALLLLGTFLGAQLRNLPFGATQADGDYELLGLVETGGSNFVRGWAEWNYSGYEGKAAYPEYRSIVSTMADVGRERGCGMSLWEYNSDLNDYGTPMALMLLPHWTDGCIGSMEGLYFEASSTTPFHFLVQSELSASPSRAQRDMPYRELDLDAGVEHLQLMGVQYYLAKSAEATAAASSHPDLTEVAASGPWVVYEVADAPMVQALDFEPAVTTSAESQDEWLGCAEGEEPCPGAALEWFQDPARWDVALAADGPADWQRVGLGQVPESRPVAPAEVSDVDVGRDGISFTVDEPGTPVLVKQSYFPNWEVSGADGPYRVAPNLMLVVPTDTEVELTYGRTGIDWLAMAMTLAGIVALVGLARSAPVMVPRLRDDQGAALAVAEVGDPADPPATGVDDDPGPVPD